MNAIGVTLVRMFVISSILTVYSWQNALFYYITLFQNLWPPRPLRTQVRARPKLHPGLTSAYETTSASFERVQNLSCDLRARPKFQLRRSNAFETPAGTTSASETPVATFARVRNSICDVQARPKLQLGPTSASKTAGVSLERVRNFNCEVRKRPKLLLRPSNHPDPVIRRRPHSYRTLRKYMYCAWRSLGYLRPWISLGSWDFLHISRRVFHVPVPRLHTFFF